MSRFDLNNGTQGTSTSFMKDEDHVATESTLPQSIQHNRLHGADDPPQLKLDPHETAPECLKAVFKEWKKYSSQSDDISSGFADRNAWSEPEEVNIHDLEGTFLNFIKASNPAALKEWVAHKLIKTLRYKSLIIPGLEVVPSLLPPLVQRNILKALLYRDLQDEKHRTNLHAHYDVMYPSEINDQYQSFFDLEKKSCAFKPKSSIHPRLTMEQVLEKKLRWITLGGQYDWTAKVYPDGLRVPFPNDIHDLVQGLYPNMDPQAAIVNLYSPGDTLSLHRDVSEEVDRGLVSISLGCAAFFIIGNNAGPTGGPPHHVIKIQSGDAVYMSGSARYAWHAVPRILSGTCPDYLLNWPQDNEWQGYMRNKRINLNVRQMM